MSMNGTTPVKPATPFDHVENTVKGLSAAELIAARWAVETYSQLSDPFKEEFVSRLKRAWSAAFPPSGPQPILGYAPQP